VSRQIHRRWKSIFAKNRVGVDEICPAVVEGDTHAAGRELSSLQQPQSFRKRQHVAIELFEGLHPACKSRWGEKHFGLERVLVAHRDAVVTKDQQPLTPPFAARNDGG